MNTTAISDIRKMAKRGIDRADDTTVRMIIAMLDVQQKEVESNFGFEEEIANRFEDYENGKIVPLSLDELEKECL